MTPEQIEALYQQVRTDFTINLVRPEQVTSLIEAMRAEMGRLQKQNASLKRMHELGWANRDCPVCGAAVSAPIDTARRGAP